ncbi:hypothetical protein TthAA22_24270 (plasmid) [Thermus thermophilus]|nr:hypothetical protein TthAA22_24270 [Thermus thermophilus]
MVVCPFLLEIIFHSISSAVRGRVSLAIASATVILHLLRFLPGGPWPPKPFVLATREGEEGVGV